MSKRTPEVGESVFDDESLVERAVRSEHGELFEALYEWGWKSDTVQRLYESKADARWHLIRKLSWWARQDRDQVIRIFKKSAFGDAWPENQADVQDDLDSAIDFLGEDCYDPTYYED